MRLPVGFMKGRPEVTLDFQPKTSPSTTGGIGVPSVAPVSTAATSKAQTAVIQAAEAAAQVNHITPIPKANISFDADRMRQTIQDAVTHLNKLLSEGGRALSFAIDHSLATPVVVVKNSQTGEVIRQFPNEEVVRMAHNIDAFKGMLHNSKN
jgi:flagellar protein FlaG